ncbi:tetratricopeptide repeat protein [Negadavirga shengliensis]|uniref:Tetratricopeptide repeat protein n=1 Tax=Negadavirga shengliensis TaxID=1389218 RepID=A0ABV9SV94_9BACT
MPNITPLFIAKLLVFFLFLFQIIDCQANVPVLQKADSLFTAKKYKEALVLYEELLDDQAYSPAMLLKMAFITEGVGDYPKASFYLSKYYEHNPNPRVINKIKELTNQGNLVGYDISDRDRFFKMLVDYKQEITASFALLMLTFLICVFVFPHKKSGFYMPAIICLTLAFFSNNFLKLPDRAIVTGSPTLIMDQPTAGGNLVRRVDAGHRVIIRDAKDIWYEIKWGDKRAYIKKENVSEI